MKPTPVHLPIWTMGLLAGGMGVFILKRYSSVSVGRVFAAAGTAVFFAGMIVALVGMIWSICTLTNPALRRTYGITTPVVTILIAAFAWCGASWTVYKFKKSSDDRTAEDAKIVAEMATPPTSGDPGR
jgi:hypothetical protein